MRLETVTRVTVRRYEHRDGFEYLSTLWNEDGPLPNPVAGLYPVLMQDHDAYVDLAVRKVEMLTGARLSVADFDVLRVKGQARVIVNIKH